MTEEQKFFFDLKGWILIPSVLSKQETTTMQDEVKAGAEQGFQGKLQELLDHPIIVTILNEILTETPFGGK